MLYIYRRQVSSGANDLAEALEAVRFRARQISIERKVRPGDFVVSWGEQVPSITGVQVLNGVPIRSKYTDALELRRAGVPTIEVSQTRPAPEVVPAPADPALTAWQNVATMVEDFPSGGNVRSRVAVDGMRRLVEAAQSCLRALQTPAPQPITRNSGLWVGRMNNHIGGNDLLTPPPAPDYYSRLETLTEEYRIHSFLGKSIRAGIKKLRDGYSVDGVTGQRASNWIRSFDGGWRIVYDDFKSKKAMRELAYSAVEALGLQFGAVDIGKKEDGSLIVLEVNRAPGLEGGTIDAYVKAIESWMSS